MRKLTSSLALLSSSLLLSTAWGADAKTSSDVGKWRDIEISNQAIGTVKPKDGAQETVVDLVIGKLKFRGGLVLSSDDKAFGGLSGLRITKDGETLYSLSDRAQWLRAKVELSETGAISKVYAGEMADMMKDTGEALRNMAGDAESLELTDDGGIVAGFERYHRLDHYAFDDNQQLYYRQRILHNRVIKPLNDNGSMESVVQIADGQIVTIAEATIKKAKRDEGFAQLLKNNELPAWFSDKENWYKGGDDWKRFAYTASPDFSVTDLAFDAPTGNVYVIERAYDPAKGVRAKVKRFNQSAIKEGAVIQPEELAHLTMLNGIDNMEGLSVRRTEDGRLMLYMLADDNFRIAQRTVLMSWEVLEDN